MLKRSALILWLFTPLAFLLAQDLESLLDRYSGPNARNYIQPLGTAIGAGLNTGLFRTAHVPEGGFHLEVRINAMAAIFSDEQRFFTASTEGVFPLEVEVETSTVVGSGEGGFVEAPNGTRYELPGGYDISALAMVVPTLTLGSYNGTEVSFRWFSTDAVQEVGTISLFGLGGRHSFSQYIPLSPIDIAAGFAYNKFEIGDVLLTEVYGYHVEVGKSFRFFDLYGGLGYGQSDIDVHYTFENDEGTDTEINLSMEGKNRFRVLGGFGFNLSLVHLHTDFSLGHQMVWNVGLAIGG